MYTNKVVPPPPPTTDCRCCKKQVHTKPSTPRWMLALERLLKLDFCEPRHSIDDPIYDELFRSTNLTEADCSDDDADLDSLSLEGPLSPLPTPSRARLFSSSMTSFQSTDTFHRRSSGQLPTPEQIWRPKATVMSPSARSLSRPKIIHMRDISTATNLTTPSVLLEQDEDDDVSFDLSESGRTQDDAEGATEFVSAQHRSNASYCSWSSNTTAQTKQKETEQADNKPKLTNIQHLYWTQNDQNDNPHIFLPLLPVPPAAAVSTLASVFTVGWVAVYWDRDELQSEESISTEHLYFVQLLSGGILQLTPFTPGQSSVLVTPSKKWSIEAVNARVGHCLGFAVAASTTNQSHAFLVPVHVKRNRIALPKVASNHQHDACIHLRFAMDAALTMDAVLRSRRRQ